MADDADLSQQAVDAEIEAAQRRTASAISKRGTQVCLGCGEEIDPRRRKAAPWSTRCLPCQMIDDLRRRG